MSKSAIYNSVKSLANYQPFLEKTQVKDSYEGSIGGEKIFSRNFNVVQSAAIRRNDYGSSFFLQNNMGVLIDSPDIIDGKEFSINDGFVVSTRSRATGHQSKVQCGWNAQKLNYSGRKLVVDTELVDASVEICPAELIGSEFQDVLMGASSINEVLSGAPQGLTDRVFESQSRFKVLTIDQNILLGDTGKTSDIPVGSGRKTRVAHHIDGVLKQIYNATKGQYYPVKKWDLSGETSGGVTIWHGGQYLFVSDASTTTISNFINGLKDAASAAKLYTVQVPATGKIQVTSHEPTVDVSIEIYKGNVGNQMGQTPIAFERIENPMSHDDAPKQMPYERINQQNAVDFFVSLFRRLAIDFGLMMAENPNVRFYLGHDPVWSIELMAALSIVSNDNNSNGLMSKIEEMVRLIPVPQYMGMGVFYGTYNTNVAVLTNSFRGDLGTISVYVDPLSGKVHYKNKMLLNAKVLDFASTISNVAGWADANNYEFNSPYVPYAPNGVSPDIRPRAATSEVPSKRARAEITIETAGDPAVESVTFEAVDDMPSGVTVSGYEWIFHLDDGTTASSTNGPLSEVDLAPGKKLILVEYKATYSDGVVDTVSIPLSGFNYVEGN